MATVEYRIHGDNIVECERTLSYVRDALGDLVVEVEGPLDSLACPRWALKLNDGSTHRFTFLPGYGERRWNCDVLAFVQNSGGRLREAADALLTRLEADGETPLAAIEFCGALPAGNQAWQRQGRAFSYAHAGIPFFYVAELGGFELDAERKLKAERLPNPAVPFSFVATTIRRGSPCLPVYQPNIGTSQKTADRFADIYGRNDFLGFIRAVLLGQDPEGFVVALEEKATALVGLLALSKKRTDGLNPDEWTKLLEYMRAGGELTTFLSETNRIGWRKTAYIADLTDTARALISASSGLSYGLTSSSLPISFIPREERAKFRQAVEAIYGPLPTDDAAWFDDKGQDLVIAWVMGFKPRGDDARPDRGLPPLARMLAGDSVHLLTFVYGPGPKSHWTTLQDKPGALIRSNGLWESILGVSDAVLVDSATVPAALPRLFRQPHWAAEIPRKQMRLDVTPEVRSLSEQDVDLGLHVMFASLGAEIVLEGLCNPPGGDWSGISFAWGATEPEHRWLTLPRVSADGAKRPDHVFALFTLADCVTCLSVESKERPSDLEGNIGPRLRAYTDALFDVAPSVSRSANRDPWGVNGADWVRKISIPVSMGAFLGSEASFARVRNDTALDVLCAFEFEPGGADARVHVRALTAQGQTLARFMADHFPSVTESGEAQGTTLEVQV